jgi:ABC-type spermidine/putrescine transport system permease subunit I
MELRDTSRLLRASRYLLLLPTALVVLACFVVPLVLTGAYSLGTSDLVTFETHFGLSLQNYANLRQAVYLDAIVRSLVLSATATAVCAVIAIPLAFFIVEQPPRLQMLLLLAVIVPFWTSFLIRTYAWVNILQNGGPLESLLQRLGLLHGPLNVLYSPLAIGVGIVFSYLPLMVLPIYVALERRDPAVLEAAADLGSHGAGLVWHVVIPLARTGIIAGCILVGIPATGEFVIPAILGGGKTLMLGNVIGTQFLETGNLALGSAMAMSLLGLVVLLLAVIPLFRRGTTA